MVQKKAATRNMLGHDTANMVFYENSFAKTAFFTKEISNWDVPIFYFDFDLQYTGFVNTGITPSPKNLTIFNPENGNLHKDLKHAIEKISKIKSLVIIDSLNGFFNFLENKKDLGRLINSFLMLLVSSAKHTKSTVIVGILSKRNNEDKWILYNTGRQILENEHFTKIQLTGSDSSTLVKVLNPNNIN